MDQKVSGGLPDILQFHPEWIVDPVPDWWLRKVDERLQAELIGLRMQTREQVLRAEADAMAKAAEIIQSRLG